MATVREDRHGLYVKAGGYVFRPVFPVGYQHVYEDRTKHAKGDKPSARHKGGTPLAKVGQEVWFSHGAYLSSGTALSSEGLYKPDHHSW